MLPRNIRLELIFEIAIKRLTPLDGWIAVELIAVEVEQVGFPFSGNPKRVHQLSSGLMHRIIQRLAREMWLR